MHRFRRVFFRFYLLFTDAKAEAEAAREIAAHLTLLEDEYVAQGMSSTEARVAAKRAYGGVEQAKQLHRDERAFQGLALILQDLRYTFRQLRKSAGFTVTAILMLALGIGSTTAIFSIVEGVLLRPLPFSDPDRIVILGDVLEGSHCSFCTHAYVTAPDIRNYMRDTHSFAQLGGYQGTDFELSRTGEPITLNATRMSSEVFAALRVKPLLGRVFTPQEDEENQHVAVLSYDMWRSRFHGDASILGSNILLDREPFMVLGVMPRNFEFPLKPGHVNQSELWVPLSLRPEEFVGGSAASWTFRMVGRLKPGLTAALAQKDAERVARETMSSYAAFMRTLRIRATVTPLHKDTVEQARPLLRTLLFAVIVVLLIACANLAGLLLVRSIRRRREIAVRLALGARAGTLLQQAIVESIVLSFTGGAIGLALAATALRTGVRLLPNSLPRIDEIGLDWQLVLVALGLALLTGLLCGLAPAFAAIRTSGNEALKEGGHTGSAGGSHTRLRSALVVAEIAVALILLTASGLLLRSFEKMRDVNLGFQPDRTLAAIYGLPHNEYASQSAVDTFSQELLRSLRELPGAEAVGIISALPATGNYPGIAFTIEGYAPTKGAGLNMAGMSLVRGDPFRALRIRLLRGRSFTETDQAGSPLVAIVNRKMAQRYWPGQDPIGKRLRRGMLETSTPWMTVVGEVDSVKMGSPDEETVPQVYQPVTQSVASEGVFAASGEISARSGWIVVRSRVASEQMKNMLRSAVQRIDPQLALTQMRTMEQVISDSESARRFNTVLISSFAATAVLLSILGIYAVIAFSVAQRKQEIAVRIALGCQHSSVLMLVLSSGVRLAVAGCVLGLLGAAAVSRLMRSFLFEVSPFDPAVLTLSVLAMLLLALAASALPAKRASKTEPMLALRGE